ncbi:Alpha/beta hydrolase fold-1 [Dillenia turbinata]|uniref:Alpha/beta hydrolase fold-1 n=1 Tax=Dillenia turbinata TaxID=194707 RepID=A0AAN8UAM1_9MAGN
MLSLWLYHIFSLYLSLILSLFSATRSIAQDLLNVKRVYIFVPLVDILLSLYFRFCGLSPLTVDLDEQTVMHFWIANHRRCNKPDLVLVHGNGGNSRWQFLNQVGSLSKSFNLYIPDLLFFGRSKTTRLDRSDALQAECVSEGLKRLGVERCAVFGVSYGGYVAYRMAEMHQQMVENVVIVSSGVCCAEDQKGSQLKKIKMEVVDLLVPKKPQDLRSLAKMSFYKYDPFKWIPDYFLQEFIDGDLNLDLYEKRDCDH